MAKTAAKKTTAKEKSAVKPAAKKSAPKKSAPKKAKASTEDALEATMIHALEKLESMALDVNLQADIRWCIGSYRFDKNPVGLIEMAGKSLKVFNAAKKSDSKAVPAKLISDLKKVVSAK
jgi:uncharacterized ferritin-like protein (DUF455 family)